MAFYVTDVLAGFEKLKRLKTFGRGREPELAQELTGLIERLATQVDRFEKAAGQLQDKNIRLAQENTINSNLLEGINKANDLLHDQIAELNEESKRWRRVAERCEGEKQRFDAALEKSLMLANTIADGNFNQADVINTARLVRESIQKVRAGE